MVYGKVHMEKVFNIEYMELQKLQDMEQLLHLYVLLHLIQFNLYTPAVNAIMKVSQKSQLEQLQHKMRICYCVCKKEDKKLYFNSDSKAKVSQMLIQTMLYFRLLVLPTQNKSYLWEVI
jgi:hypothetical protein